MVTTEIREIAQSFFDLENTNQDLKSDLKDLYINSAVSLAMDPKLTEVSQIFERFKAAFVRSDFDTCRRLLSQLKVLLTEFPSLPPLFQKTANAVHELTLAREIYEHAVVLSVKTEDQDAFERDFFQLKPYYTDTCGLIPPSPQEYPILGLNLLRLLVQNRIAEFHTELELLPASALENPYIKHAVELEQSFMEGAYNRVLSARQTVPHDTYVYFMDLLAKTVRDEIAGCSEKAYDYLSVADAKQIMMFSSDQELAEYIEVEHPEWEIKRKTHSMLIRRRVLTGFAIRLWPGRCRVGSDRFLRFNSTRCPPNAVRLQKPNSWAVKVEEDPALAVVRFTGELAWSEAGPEVAEPQVTALYVEAQDCMVMGRWLDLASLMVTSAELVFSRVPEKDL
ncbi:hypothetical protein H6P81_017629 [Aristolochia fimbriata]|uniref:PCI domain-containing protein n=1 Tax=Aristolochia fimbriata TaxID=158543 RepID=A0AAV7E0P3_ARIFI|nr:hypothetical protein H6P81_017629 [Aristolochia fimbriata]